MNERRITVRTCVLGFLQDTSALAYRRQHFFWGGGTDAYADETESEFVLRRGFPQASFVQPRNQREIVFLLTCLSLLHSSSYVTRSALSTQTHYQQTRYESSALLPPPDPAVNPPPPQPQPPCLGCQRKSFRSPLDQQ